MESARNKVRSAADLDSERVNHVVSELGERSKTTVQDRVHAVRANFVLALQAGVAALLSWYISHDVLGNTDPVFAPISAVGTLAASLGQRLRRTVELILGVAVGIGIGDLLIIVVGSGPWQLGLIVTLSIIVTIFLGGSVAVVTQAAATAVLLVALAPKMSNVEFPRVIDALVGGGVGLFVVALLLPLNPLRIVDRAARPALETLAEQLTVTAEALAEHDPVRASTALDRLRRVEEYMDGLQEALEGGRETATLAPARWNRRRALTRYAESAEYINHAVHNSGVLVRRAVTALEDDEPIPAAMASAVRQLADAVRLLHQELGAGLDPEAARERVLRSVTAAGRAYSEGVGFSGSVVVAQIRTTASDVLRATGIERTEANRLVRRAVSTQTSPTRSSRPSAH
ncbi:FUSC family protein [Micromonospora sp. NBC_01796]|uniref:FUSC family protein n=1 Tax=Micromonospora sp. NBC_01796 TaxID=2975987 RepID=UPI002DDABB9B|nr:FUSC family protein [Micromonospora sp. NBC_01796]WSA89010.1 FUSC family protein [Micromonospora sp. NBC_01796]